MRKRFSVTAKRLLSFALALVLLLSLCPALPLTAEAGEWSYTNSAYASIQFEFRTSDSDRVFENNQAYDWVLTSTQSLLASASIGVVPTITAADGTTYSGRSKVITMSSGQPAELVSWSDFSTLTTDIFGEFTLSVELHRGSTSTVYGTYTETFSRVVAEDKNATFTATSRSNPDKIFTYADPIDLELNIIKTNGVAEAFNAVTTITNASGETVSSGTYPIPSSTNTTVSVKDLVPVTGIKTPGNYNVNVTLNDAGGNRRYKTTIPFAVVALNGSVEFEITAESTYTDVTPNPAIKVRKKDGIEEKLTAYITVTNTDSNIPEFQQAISGAVSSNVTTIRPSLSELSLVGSFRMNVVITDDAGNVRGRASTSFTREYSKGLEVTLTDNTGISKYGNIFNQDEKPLVLNITHPNGVGEILKVKFTGTYNGAALNETYNVQIPAQGSISVEPKYGIYENLAITVYDASGNEVYPNFDNPSTYTFTYVRSEADPGELPLLNVNDHFTSGHGDDTTRLNLTAQTGAAMWRATMPWSTIEPTVGNYISMTSIINNVIQPTLDLGLEPIVILAYNNDKYGDADPTSSTWLNAYANYCAEVARQLKGKVRYYEIWNEWNASMGKVPEAYRTGDYYAKVLVAASEAIKAVDPNAQIIGGAVAGDTGQEDWIRAMLSYDANRDGNSDAIAAMDGFSFHSYAVSKTNLLPWDTNHDFDTPAEHGYTTRFQFINDLLTEYGADESMEIWMTETGWATNAKGQTNGKYYTGVSEQQQAAYLVQLYTWALAHPNQVDRIFWYDLMNDGTDNTQVEQNWGLVNNYSVGYTAKQSYVATCAMSSMLAGAKNGTTVNLGSGIYAYRFEKDDHYLMAVWTDGTAKSCTATLNGSMVVTDMFGNATSYLNSAPLTLSEAPIYLEYGLHANPTIG